jgi:hypothetical protein
MPGQNMTLGGGDSGCPTCIKSAHLSHGFFPLHVISFWIRFLRRLWILLIRGR